MHILFALMCLIWGSTWIAMKFGVATVPPIVFGGTRFIVAGLVLLAVAAARRELRAMTAGEIGRLVIGQLLLVVLTYAPLFWAMRYVPSGLAAVLDLALMPVCLLGFGVMFAEERWTTLRSLALAFGFAGLGLLFAPQIVMPSDPMALLGAGAIILSTVVYSLGSVIARPLARTLSATAMSGLTLLPGGLVLVGAAALFEPGAADALAFRWSAEAWAGWLFLVLFGSLVAFTAYMRLIAEWGPARAGSYAYISPVIAVALGVAVMGETVGLREGLGMALLLAAAFCSLRPAPLGKPVAMASSCAAAVARPDVGSM